MNVQATRHKIWIHKSFCLLKDVVIVSFHTEIVGCYKGEQSNGDFRFTRVWRKFKDSWQVVAGYSSVVAFLD